LSKAKSLKLDHGLFVFGVDRGFVIKGKAHGHKSSDRGYSNVADFKAGRNYGEPQLETHDLDQ
jgi:hypothetical protein